MKISQFKQKISEAEQLATTDQKAGLGALYYVFNEMSFTGYWLLKFKLLFIVIWFGLISFIKSDDSKLRYYAHLYNVFVIYNGMHASFKP